MTTEHRTEVPTSTYRLQLRGGMDFERAATLVPYLARLGIEHLYLSPIFAAYSGSAHGYDVIDPNRVDPEIGGRAGFDWLVAALARAGMGVLLDIVPNHMRAHSDNLWWRDVLEHGAESRYAAYFDLRWSADVEHRVVLPILGEHYCQALDRGDLVPGRDSNGFVVRYHEFVAPLDPATWPVILDRAAAIASHAAALEDLSDACHALPARAIEHRDSRARAASRLGARLRSALQWPEVAAAIDTVLGELRGTPGDEATTAPLHALLDAQPWRVAYWRSGVGELNYRRFFDVAELVALRSERDEVFDATHALLAELLRCQIPVGVRVDHVDGLADARGYLRRLRDLGVRWLVVEKILGEEETMRGDWPCDGTTGYEVCVAITRALIDPDGVAVLHAAWRERNDGIELADAGRQAKLQVLDSSFDHTLRSLAADLRRLTQADRRARDVSIAELERALRELTVSLQVYRTYVESTASGGIDRDILAGAVERATTQLVPDDRLALDFVARVLRNEPSWADERALEVATVVRRWQQLTGPVAAKGIEDTLLFRWTALGALAEVGAPLQLPTAPVEELHHALWRRRRTQRAPLVTIATHDTKHGGDSRARLGVISQLAPAWLACTDDIARRLGGDREEVELLLQTYVATLPNTAEADYGARLHAAMTKMLREAKRHTDWMRPNAAYEAEAHARVDALLAAIDTTDWGRGLSVLQQRIAFHGAHDSLAQLTIELAAPGVCDVYQGAELWDLSMVDPDNRRVVDFERRAQVLEALESRHRDDAIALLAELREQWSDGRIKAFTLWRGLQLRLEHRGAFVDGQYHPLEATGRHASCLCAFYRRGAIDDPNQRDTWIVAVVARTTTHLVEPPSWPIGSACWADEVVALPSDAPVQWRDGWTGSSIAAPGGRLRVADIFADLPIALLVGSRQ
jgi:(1->4)-alpha-D-glucan 1-alpha-D-glucosylmutase